MPKCKHINIIITRKEQYVFEEGYKKASEEENVDLDNYFIDEFDTKVYCQDCDTVLEEVNNI